MTFCVLKVYRTVVVLATAIHPTKTIKQGYLVLRPCVFSDAISVFSTLSLWAVTLFVRSGMLEL